MSIKIEHKITKFEKYLTTSQFSYETFYYLWVKGFDIRKRDTHSFYSGFFICPPPHLVRHQPKASASKQQVSSQVTDFSSARFRCMTSFALTSLRFPSRAIVTSLSDTSTARARTWTPALMLHLSNPCTEPKGSQPN